MDNNNIVGTLMYTVMPIVVTIISAIVMWVKLERYEIGDALRCILLGVLWPLALVAGVVYLASDFLYSKFFKAREEN